MCSWWDFPRLDEGIQLHLNLMKLQSKTKWPDISDDSKVCSCYLFNVPVSFIKCNTPPNTNFSAFADVRVLKLDTITTNNEYWRIWCQTNKLMLRPHIYKYFPTTKHTDFITQPWSNIHESLAVTVRITELWYFFIIFEYILHISMPHIMIFCFPLPYFPLSTSALFFA